MQLSEMQQAIDRWISRYKDGYWPPLVNLTRLVEEVGELARALNHREGLKKPKPGEVIPSVAEELGDIVYTVAVIANSLGIDLDSVMNQTLDKVEKRDSNRFEKHEDQ